MKTMFTKNDEGVGLGMSQYHLFITFLFVALGALTLASCIGKKNKNASGADGDITTGMATDVTVTNATITSMVSQEFLANAKYLDFGVSYGEDENADDDCKHADTIKDTTFISTLDGLFFETTYYYKAFACDEKGNYTYGSTHKFTTSPLTQSSDKAVDLGLPSGTKWADRNVGASKPEDEGGYFAWGETTTKEKYSKENSLTYDMSYSDIQSKGIVDSNWNLTAKHDAATADWGGEWHTPTLAQIRELGTICKWKWVRKKGVWGCIVIGTNGNSIFLPAAGYCIDLVTADDNQGCYWSSTRYKEMFNDAYCIAFDKDGVGSFSFGNTSHGLLVRPVKK